MNPQVNLVRAIGSEFVRRKLQTIVITYVIVAALLISLIYWLLSMSAWWLLLAIPLTIGIIIGLAVLVAARLIIKRLRPDLTKQQSKEVKNFVDKLERVAENVQLPMFMIVFQVIRDIARPRSKTFVQTMAEDSTTMHTDFIALQRNFK